MFTFVMLPPQTETTRDWARRLRAAMPDLNLVVAESEPEALQAISTADAAFGTPSADLLAHAEKLRWLQARRPRRRPVTIMMRWSGIR